MAHRIDVGGTHTDLVAVDWITGQAVTEKVLPCPPIRRRLDRRVQAFLKKTGELLTGRQPFPWDHGCHQCTGAITGICTGS